MSRCFCGSNKALTDQSMKNRFSNGKDGTESTMLDKNETFKAALGGFLMDEISKGLHSGVKTQMTDYIDDLQEKLKNFEDYIGCLEEQVRELQNMIREYMSEEGTSKETSSTSHTKDDAMEENGNGPKDAPKNNKPLWVLWGKQTNNDQKEVDA